MNRLKHYREQAGISQLQLAELCGWASQSRISTYESGRTPALDDCRTIVRALNSRLSTEATIDDVFPPGDDAEQAA